MDEASLEGIFDQEEGYFPARFLALKDLTPAKTIQNLRQQLNAAALLYLDFQVEYRRNDLCPDMKKGAVMARFSKVLSVYYVLNDHCLLNLTYYSHRAE